MSFVYIRNRAKSIRANRHMVLEVIFQTRALQSRYVNTALSVLGSSRVARSVRARRQKIVCAALANQQGSLTSRIANKTKTHE